MFKRRHHSIHCTWDKTRLIFCHGVKWCHSRTCDKSWNTHREWWYTQLNDTPQLPTIRRTQKMISHNLQHTKICTWKWSNGCWFVERLACDKQLRDRNWLVRIQRRSSCAYNPKHTLFRIDHSSLVLLLVTTIDHSSLVLPLVSCRIGSVPIIEPFAIENLGGVSWVWLRFTSSRPTQHKYIVPDRQFGETSRWLFTDFSATN